MRGAQRLIPMATLTIRPTIGADRDEIVELVGVAFTGGGGEGQEGGETVEQTGRLAAPAETIDLVAIDDDKPVGHVLAAPGNLGDTRLLAVAPLAVAPASQRRG